MLAAALTLAALPPAQAGRSCEARPLTPQAVRAGLDMARRVSDALDASGAQVVVLARAGQDLRRFGLHWSHLGLAYRESLPGGGTAWRVVHKLNLCGTAEGGIYRQGLGPFFLDDLWREEAAWVVPSPALQARLLPLLRDDARAVALQHKPYSLVSYAWGQRYQQSNQWALETIASAMAPDTAGSRVAAQGWLRAQGYQPTVLTLDALTRLGGRLFSANVAFDDHPPADRLAGRIATVTVESIFAWLQQDGLGGPSQVVALTP